MGKSLLDALGYDVGNDGIVSRNTAGDNWQQCEISFGDVWWLWEQVSCRWMTARSLLGRTRHWKRNSSRTRILQISRAICAVTVTLYDLCCYMIRRRLTWPLKSAWLWWVSFQISGVLLEVPVVKQVTNRCFGSNYSFHACGWDCIRGGLQRDSYQQAVWWVYTVLPSSQRAMIRLKNEWSLASIWSCRGRSSWSLVSCLLQVQLS